MLVESLPDSRANRERVADALDFQGGYRRLLVDLGVLFIDNDTATTEHLEAMYRLMMAMPKDAWDVETITVAGWLGPAVKTQKIRSRSGINIFALPLGRPENSFDGDSPRPGATDVYLICLAHELAHNMLDTVGRRTRPTCTKESLRDSHALPALTSSSEHLDPAVSTSRPQKRAFRNWERGVVTTPPGTRPGLITSRTRNASTGPTPEATFISS